MKPYMFVTDNGPGFNNADFTTWLYNERVAHFKVLPLTPKQNGTAERGVSLVKNSIERLLSELKFADALKLGGEAIPESILRRAEVEVRNQPRDMFDGMSSSQLFLAGSGQATTRLTTSQTRTRFNNAWLPEMSSSVTKSKPKSVCKHVMETNNIKQTAARLTKADYAAARSLRSVLESSKRGRIDDPPQFFLNDNVSVRVSALPKEEQRGQKLHIGGTIVGVPPAGGQTYLVLLRDEVKPRPVHAEALVTECVACPRDKIAEIRDELYNAVANPNITPDRDATAVAPALRSHALVLQERPTVTLQPNPQSTMRTTNEPVVLQPRPALQITTNSVAPKQKTKQLARDMPKVSKQHSPRLRSTKNLLSTSTRLLRCLTHTCQHTLLLHESRATRNFPSHASPAFSHCFDTCSRRCQTTPRRALTLRQRSPLPCAPCQRRFPAQISLASFKL